MLYFARAKDQAIDAAAEQVRHQIFLRLAVMRVPDHQRVAFAL
ncbi:hypothetical protein [Cupriavidus necator]|nr:hypothetical protein [Cupriavidus necator]